MIQVVILAPYAATRAGLRLLLAPPLASQGLSLHGTVESDRLLDSLRIDVIAEAPRLADLGDLPPGTDLILFTQSAASEGELRPILEDQAGQVALLLLGEDLSAAAGISRLPVRAWGVLSQDASGEELTAAVLALYQGLCVSPPSFLASFLTRPASPLDDSGTTEPLTEREREVLQLLAQGLPNKQIALLLKISEHTVKFHISSIYSKLNAANRTEAVRLGLQRGLISL